MEMFATLLCTFSMFGGIFFVIALIVRKIRKKPKSKFYSRGLLVSIIVFIVSIILFGIFETPESKARYEQQRIEEQNKKEAEEQAKKEQAEKEQAKKEQAEKEQAEKEQAEKEQAEKEQAEKEQAEKEQAEKEQAEKEQTEKEQAEKEQATKVNSVEKTLKEKIIKVVGKENLETFNYVPDNDFALIKFKGSENLSQKMTVQGMYLDIFNILKGIQKDVDVNVDINVTYPLQDSYGNISEDIVIKATFNNQTIKKINFDNFDYKKLPSIADEWWNHSAINY